MKVKVSGDKNTLKLAFIITLLIFIMCVLGTIIYGIKTACFIDISAKVVDVSTEYSKSTRNNQNRNKYVIYKYNLNGTEYIGKRLTVFTTKKSIGTVINIRINPENPIEIQNNLTFIIFIVGIIICGMVLILVSKPK